MLRINNNYVWHAVMKDIKILIREIIVSIIMKEFLEYLYCNCRLFTLEVNNCIHIKLFFYLKI